MGDKKKPDWEDWPELLGQCFIYDTTKEEMFVGLIQQEPSGGKIWVWKGSSHYLLRDYNHQFLFKTIEWPDKPEKREKK